MSKRMPPLVLLVVVTTLVPSRAETYHVDPTRGAVDGDGSEARPWRTLEEVGAGSALEAIRGGDTVLLHDGVHGDVRLSGDHDEPVTVAAAPEARPRLARLVVPAGKGWRFRGLDISREFALEPYDGSMVSIGDGGASSDIVIEDCFVHGSLETAAWTVEDWMAAPSGVFLGRHGVGLVIRNCHIQTTRGGISLCGVDQVCEGNVVSDFSGDGIRITRDGIRVEHNIVKNAYASGADGDPNHDDAIQCFLFNVGSGTVRDVTVRRNVIIGREDDEQPLKSSMQAIGFFDGPLIDFVVEGNVVMTPHWHGISLYDAQGCRITGNVCYSRWEDERPHPWVQLGQKQGPVSGNTVTDNRAHSFDLEADPQVQASGNEKVTEREYLAAFHRLAKEIIKAYGGRCPVSDAPRFAPKRPRRR